MNCFSHIFKQCLNPPLANTSREDKHLESRLQEFIKQEISKSTSSFEENEQWKNAMEKRIEVVEQAQENMKSTSHQQIQKVSELEQEVESLQGNVFVDVSTDYD